MLFHYAVKVINTDDVVFLRELDCSEEGDEGDDANATKERVRLSTNAKALLEELFLAIEINSVKSVDRILTKKPFLVNQPCEEGYTPIFLSSMLGKVSITSHLANRGADVNRSCQMPGTNEWMTPIKLAVQRDNRFLVKILLSHGASAYAMPLATQMPLVHQAAAMGSLGALKEIVQYERNKKHQGNLKETETCNIPDALGMTAIFHAAIEGHVDIVRYLLEMKVDIEQAITPPAMSGYGSLTIRPLLRALSKINQSSPALSQKHEEIDRLLANANTNPFSDPKNILILLDKLISESQRNQAIHKTQMYIRIRNWLSDRIQNSIFKQNNIQSTILSIIMKICSMPENSWPGYFHTLLRGNNLAQDYLKNWMKWHRPMQVFEKLCYNYTNDFEIDFLRLKSIIPLPPLKSVSQMNFFVDQTSRINRSEYSPISVADESLIENTQQILRSRDF